jgi:hypothetical protein
MRAPSLVFPMLAMVLLTFAVAVALFRARMRSVREGLVPITYFRTFEGATEPEFLVKPTRHFINLFEAPILFYAGCLAAMVEPQRCPGWHRKRPMAPVRWVRSRFSGMFSTNSC